ncbi:MAG: Tol-Pal system beta propeller repeat protein TolB [Desulfobacteraceae bacterium]|nr:MAG: Tol-Pal system beta propeller repeat protein TolB [Desulfobacteraceae bacterium]
MVAKKKIRKLKLIGLMVVVGILLLAPAGALAQIKYIDLTNPFLRKIPIAIPQFRAMTPGDGESALVVNIADQVANMLDYTGYFKILDRGSFLYEPQTSGITLEELKFANWTAVGSELLVTGGVKLQGDELALEMRLFDTFKATLLVGKRYIGKPGDQRAMVRRFCSEVIQMLTGHPGMFDSRLAFVSNGTGNKEIYLCDFDGVNVSQLTKKRSITAFPNWSSDGKNLAFTSFANGSSQIFILDLKSGLEKHMAFPGVQISPVWSPNRFELAASLSIGGDQEIYLLTGGGKMIKRVTNSPGIDVEASWSPDGKKIAFVSKRAGTPQIFIQDLESGRVHRLTFQGNYNTQPNWSPKGDRIAYSSMEEGLINIYIIDAEGKFPVRLTYKQGDNEAPSWSPDGSLIAFSSSREGGSRIYVMTAFGTDQRRLLVLPGEQSQPNWSPNISP